MSTELDIDVSNLVKKYGNFTAVSDINLKVAKGEYMGLLGPNGAGKSTTLKAITGLLNPTSGSIKIQGIDIKDHRHAMEHVGSVIETPDPYPQFTPADLLQHVGRIYGLDRQEIAIRSRDVLEEMKLWDWRYKSIGGFSKGMRQRVVLAQALLSNPEIIILDEPTSGLDPRGMIEIRELLKGMKKRDRTLLISTHILSEVSEICGSVTMIRDGKAILAGDVSELLSGSSNSLTLEIKVFKDINEQFVTDMSGCQGVQSCEVLGEHIIKLEFNGSTEDQLDVVNKAFGSGLGVLSVNEKGKNLESLYMEMTKNEREGEE